MIGNNTREDDRQMSLASAPMQPAGPVDWPGLMRALGVRFAERAPDHDGSRFPWISRVT